MRGLFPAVLLLVALAGCAKWQPQGLTPQAVIERDHPSRVQVIRRDSSRLELRSPVIRGDSLEGVTNDGSTGVALADIAYVSINRGNKAGIAALTGVGVAAGLITLIAATWNN